MAELVDAPDLGSGVSRRVGSSPIRRTLVSSGQLVYSCPELLFYADGCRNACGGVVLRLFMETYLCAAH